MPRNPTYSGSLASQVLPYSPTPQPSLISQIAARKGSLVSSLKDMFYNPEGDPEFQRARLYAAQAAEAERTRLKQEGVATAVSDAGSQLQQIMTDGRILPGADPNVVRAGVLSHLTPVAAAGGTEADISPLLKLFGLARGDDQFTTQMNSNMEGKYLGDNQSPSLAAQVAKREDEQSQATSLATMEDATKRYGMGLESGDRRYASDNSRAASEYGSRQSAGASMYGSDRDFQAAENKRRSDNYFAAYDRNNPAGNTMTEEVTLSPDKSKKTTTRTQRTIRTPATRPAGSRATQADPLGIR